MNKYEFLAAIRQGLDGIDKNNIDRSLDYYREMIDDRIDEGLTEEEAVAALGSVDGIVAEIRATTDGSTDSDKTPPPEKEEREEEESDHLYGKKISPEAKDKINKGLKVLADVLYALVAICFWCFAVPTLIVGISLCVAFFGTLFSSFAVLLSGKLVEFLVLLGASLCLAGAGSILTVAMTALIRVSKPLGKRFREELDNSLVMKGDRI
ncbi:MAG: DUF1700 domain-containing protein [Clostridia bacterium]|nr:DUF1700 domain-containing protein [Clostridia bacterium]